MTTREEAEAAIRLWCKLGLAQKRLAYRAGVSDTAVSKILHQPAYTRSAEVYRRIRDVVEMEVATRIELVPLSVVSMCETAPRVFDAATTAAVIANVKDKLLHLSEPDAVTLPDGIRAAIMRMGVDGIDTGLFVVAIADGTRNQRITALIHELDHLKEYLASGLRQEFKSPRSAF